MLTPAMLAPIPRQVLVATQEGMMCLMEPKIVRSGKNGQPTAAEIGLVDVQPSAAAKNTTDRSSSEYGIVTRTVTFSTGA